VGFGALILLILRQTLADCTYNHIGVFGLRNHFIQNVVVHHGFIPQIWCDDLISRISTN
jgi:hypothetical protein